MSHTSSRPRNGTGIVAAFDDYARIGAKLDIPGVEVIDSCSFCKEEI